MVIIFPTYLNVKQYFWYFICYFSYSTFFYQ